MSVTENITVPSQVFDVWESGNGVNIAKPSITLNTIGISRLPDGGVAFVVNMGSEEEIRIHLSEGEKSRLIEVLR